MLDVEKLAQEFIFLREKLRDIAGCLFRHETVDAAFMIGCLHSICHNHSVSISKLIPPKPIQPEEIKNEPTV